METKSDLRFGETIEGALRELEADGYTGSFRPSGPDRIVCLSCQHAHDPRAVRLEDLVRVEGVSDPADEAVVAALECPTCHNEGTIVLSFGPAGAAEEAEIFRALKDRRGDEQDERKRTGIGRIR